MSVLAKLTARLVSSVATADVGVHPHEPNLLQRAHLAISSRCHSSLGEVGGEEHGVERLAQIVDRHGVIGVQHAGAELETVELVWDKDVEDAVECTVWYAERCNGVPDAEKIDGGPHRMVFLYEALSIHIPRLRLLVDLPSFVDELAARLGQNTEVVDEARKAANRRGAAAESEEEDLVAGLVVLEDELVALQDVFREAPAPDVPCRLAPSRAQAPVVERHLTRRSVRDHVEEFVDVRVVVCSALLPRAVGEDHDVLGHACLPPSHPPSAPASDSASTADDADSFIPLFEIVR